jgi:hypothetical protein
VAIALAQNRTCFQYANYLRLDRYVTVNLNSMWKIRYASWARTAACMAQDLCGMSCKHAA